MCDVSNCNRGKENKFHFDSDNNNTYSIGIRKTSYFRYLLDNLPNHNYKNILERTWSINFIFCCNESAKLLSDSAIVQSSPQNPLITRLITITIATNSRD